jgi:hypothetical protein
VQPPDAGVAGVEGGPEAKSCVMTLGEGLTPRELVAEDGVAELVVSGPRLEVSVPPTEHPANTAEKTSAIPRHIEEG